MGQNGRTAPCSMSRAQHVDAIDLEQSQSPNRIAQMPDRRAPGAPLTEPLGRDSHASRLVQGKRGNHGNSMLQKQTDSRGRGDWLGWPPPECARVRIVVGGNLRLRPG